MKRDFNFEKTGKRMPYSTPEGFFDELEENIWKEVGKPATATADTQPARKRGNIRTLTKVILGTAAAAALLAAVNLNLYKADAATSADIEEAFSQLSTDDQEFMLSVYQDDVFFNE
ncbi:MAG: hypothetical protein MR989_05205 [Prevotella sp.]|nr:hypothetical protein [Prevotella sp.]MCI7509266.1 hypothetical protein [Prevotella sp.]